MSDFFSNANDNLLSGISRQGNNTDVSLTTNMPALIKEFQEFNSSQELINFDQGTNNIVTIDSNQSIEISTGVFDNIEPIIKKNDQNNTYHLARVTTELDELTGSSLSNNSIKPESIQSQDNHLIRYASSEPEDFSQSVDVMRFWDKQAAAHFFTANPTEIQELSNNPDRYQNEGNEFDAADPSSPGVSPVYRYLNQTSQTYFYSLVPPSDITSQYPVFTDDGIAFYAYKQNDAPSGSIMVHRFYNEDTSNRTQSPVHFFTANEENKQTVMKEKPNFKYEEFGWYAYPSEFNLSGLEFAPPSGLLSAPPEDSLSLDDETLLSTNNTSLHLTPEDYEKFARGIAYEDHDYFKKSRSDGLGWDYNKIIALTTSSENGGRLAVGEEIPIFSPPVQLLSSAERQQLEELTKAGEEIIEGTIQDIRFGLQTEPSVQNISFESLNTLPISDRVNSIFEFKLPELPDLSESSELSELPKYKVDQIFEDNQNSGFYAVGLTSPDSELAPLLLIRGTGGSPRENAKAMITDILVDSHPIQPGYTQYELHKSAIEQWLENVTFDQVKNPSLAPPDMTGHSLGAALVQSIAADYTSQGNELGQIITFNSPGIDDSLAKRFNPNNVQNVMHYVMEGDIVSLAGEEFIKGDVLSTGQKIETEEKVTRFHI